MPETDAPAQEAPATDDRLTRNGLRPPESDDTILGALRRIESLLAWRFIDLDKLESLHLTDPQLLARHIGL